MRSPLVIACPLLLAWLVTACSSSSGGEVSPSSGEEPSPGEEPSSSPDGDHPSGTGLDGGGSGSTEDGGDSAAIPDRAECKRGVGYGYHSVADMRALRAGVSWWYNWAFEPDTGVRDAYTSLGVEYVPMVWGAKTDIGQAAARIPAGIKAMLGFNEPNFREQANLSAKEAAARWPAVQAVADAKGATLVSPAVNYCGGACQETDPFKYLDDFFAACKDCRVDALGVHIYVACAGDGQNHARWLIDILKNYEKRYRHPIWLTEFACYDGKNDGEVRAFMKDAVAHLESDPRVVRYAWFAGRADNVPYVNLLGADGRLTALGGDYVAAPQPAACRR